jgi:N-acetylneuraminate synthase
VAIEKHLTLRRADGGVDSAFSLEPHELAQVVEGARIAWQALGTVTYARAGSEAGNVQFRRSLYVVKDIPAGARLSEDCVRSIRPGYGLPPKWLPRVVGRRAARFLARGTPLDMASVVWDGD